jgi:hypothetical protein
VHERSAHWDLFPRTDHLHPFLRFIHGVLAIVGTLAVLLALFCVVLDITTAPAASRASVWLGVVSAMVSAAHVVWEARSAKPISVARWLAFAVAQGVFGYDLWVNIGDATGKRVFLTMLLLRGLFLLVARWVVTKNQGDSHG